MKLIIILKIAVFLVISEHVVCQGDNHEPESKNIKELVHSNNNFAFRLLELLGTQNEGANLFFSPTSISVALAMVYLGSRGNTATQISDALGWTEYKREDIHTGFKTLHEDIHTSEDEAFELRLANRIWGHDNLQPSYEFTSAMKDFYGSEITLVDFVKSSDEVRKDVNQWVHQETKGKIPDFLPPGILNSGTKLALINAIYFNGAWKSEFDKEKTFHAPFYASGNRELKMEVNMMTKTSRQKYYFDQEHNCHVLELPYSGNELSMVLVLPEELDGISRLERSLNIENLDKWMMVMVNTTVSVSLPRFKLNQQIDLKNILPKLGIQDVFYASKADLSGITASGGLFVSNVIHKAHVDVNERGTEAAAATGVTMMKRSLDLNEVFHADHPFIFFIRHHFSGSILFAGKVMQPSGLVEEEIDLPKRTVADEL